jgi:hypothetical protein
MDMVTNAINALPSDRAAGEIQMAVLKKAIDAQAQGALGLIQALPDPRAGLPASVGNRINVSA